MKTTKTDNPMKPKKILSKKETKIFIEKHKPKPKAIIYARFSPRRNEEESESIETQLHYCRAYCKKQGYEIAGEFEDRAISGADENRPGLWNAIDSLKRDYILIVHRWDRLARDVYLSEYIEREIAKKKATIQAIEGGVNGEDKEKKLIRQILNAFAEYERKCIAVRTKTAMLRHQASGRRMSDTPPYGLVRDPFDRAMLLEEPEEQEVISKIINLYNEQKGLREICRLLEADGITCRGGAWYHTTIRNILRRAGIVTEE